MAVPKIVDCAVIGGGPAGLSAAIYLARYLRYVVVFDVGQSRARWITTSHNLPGFPEGISGTDLLEKMQVQAERFGAGFCRNEVLSIDPVKQDFVVTASDHNVVARSVLLATGVVNRQPPVSDEAHSDALARGLLRYCPVCDGFEARDMRIGVIGSNQNGVAEALFLGHYSEKVTLLTLEEPRIGQGRRQDLKAAGITIVTTPISGIEFGDRSVSVETGGRSDKTLIFDTVYPALGSQANSGIASKLGALLGDDQCLLVDAHQRATVPGIYAAGDLVLGLDQVSVAMGQAAIAATAIHNDLRIRDDEAA